MECSLYFCLVFIDGTGNSSLITHKHCGVEQLVARRAHNPKVAGSSPAPATKAERHKQIRMMTYISNITEQEQEEEILLTGRVM